jgi:hypothetical protein
LTCWHCLECVHWMNPALVSIRSRNLEFSIFSSHSVFVATLHCVQSLLASQSSLCTLLWFQIIDWSFVCLRTLILSNSNLTGPPHPLSFFNQLLQIYRPFLIFLFLCISAPLWRLKNISKMQKTVIFVWFDISGWTRVSNLRSSILLTRFPLRFASILSLSINQTCIFVSNMMSTCLFAVLVWFLRVFRNRALHESRLLNQMFNWMFQIYRPFLIFLILYISYLLWTLNNISKMQKTVIFL